jgi:choline kinase
LPIISTVVINAAGTGSRIGLNIPKSMIEINGKSLIERQLDQLSGVENIVAVVGFKGRELTNLIWQIRRDVIIAVNHNYQSTGTASSFVIGSKVATSRVISLDGDLIVASSDMAKFLSSSEDLVGVVAKRSKLPVLAKMQNSNVIDMGFELDSDQEWTGLLSIQRSKALLFGNSHVFQGLKQFLPLKAEKIDCFEIDEPEDISNAETWLKNLEEIHD